MADIDSDGPFSAFPGVERWFAVLAGVGVALTFAAGERHVLCGDPPLAFDGGAAPECRLLDGPTRDLNLMSTGKRSTMRAVVPGAAWDEPFAMRGLFTGSAGRWSADGKKCDLGAHTLLWEDAAQPGEWRFEPAGPAAGACGWWLGFTPVNVPVLVR